MNCQLPKEKPLNSLNDSILHIDVSAEGLVIVHNLRSFDQKTVTLESKKKTLLEPFLIKSVVFLNAQLLKLWEWSAALGLGILQTYKYTPMRLSIRFGLIGCRIKGI